MKTIPNIILQDNNQIPQLGFGTWQLTGSTCVSAVKTALKLGYTHIDTAEIYGNESEVGKAITSSGIPRENLFITSKLWLDHLDYEDALEACKGSLKRLGTDYLDLYLIHWPDSNKEIAETLRAFKTLIETGLVKSVGVSNFTTRHLAKTLILAEELKIPICINQVEFHPFLFQKDLLNFCTDHKMSITAYSPIARGLVFNNQEIRDISNKHSKTPAQVALRWLIQHNIIAIPKAASEEHAKQNLEIFDYTLDDHDMNVLDSNIPQKRLINPEFAEFNE